jgi:prepilin-type N-terminal cleavage/methylation domain-containing protein
VSPKQSRGFTLIELLLVLAIMMTLLGLVGGNVIESVQRTRAQAEVVSFLELLKKCGVAAFASGQSLSVALDGKRVTIEPSPTGQVNEVVYEYLDFEVHQITFFRNGLPDTVNLSVDVGGKPRQLDFAEMFDSSKE